MGMRWKVQRVQRGEAEEGGLDGWEPFAVANGFIYVKKEVFVEDDELKSSAHHPNWMGNEPDEEEE